MSPQHPQRSSPIPKGPTVATADGASPALTRDGLNGNVGVFSNQVPGAPMPWPQLNPPCPPNEPRGVQEPQYQSTPLAEDWSNGANQSFPFPFSSPFLFSSFPFNGLSQFQRPQGPYGHLEPQEVFRPQDSIGGSVHDVPGLHEYAIDIDAPPRLLASEEFSPIAATAWEASHIIPDSEASSQIGIVTPT
jgi:hypothetical protein